MHACIYIYVLQLYAVAIAIRDVNKFMQMLFLPWSARWEARSQYR